MMLVGFGVIIALSVFGKESNVIAEEEKKDKKYKPGDIEILHSDRAPKPIGSYNIGTKLHHDGYSVIYTAGQIGIDPKTGQLVEGLEAQTEQAIKNLEAIITDNGGSLDKVVRAQLYLSDMRDFATVDKIYSK